MKEIKATESVPMRITLLYLEKLEKLTKKERSVIISSIDLMNHPVFITDKTDLDLSTSQHPTE